LIIADPDHVDLAFETEETTGKTESASPLAGPGFGRDPFDSEDFVVIGLGNGGIGFVTARWADALIL